MQPTTEPTSTTHDSPSVHVVLFQPEIPQNTGNIGRTCVALRAKLWIVRPTAFRLDAKQVRRAGLDYWPFLNWEIVDSWEHLKQRLPCDRIWLITKFGTTSYWDAKFQVGDVLVFGRETTGLPESIRGEYPNSQISIPMPGEVRSLNLANSVAVVMYEAARQMRAQFPDSHFVAPARSEAR